MQTQEKQTSLLNLGKIREQTRGGGTPEKYCARTASPKIKIHDDSPPESTPPSMKTPISKLTTEREREREREFLRHPPLINIIESFLP